MVQVVTSENLVEFVQTGKVAEFKAPDAAKADDKPADTTTDTKAGTAPAADAAKAADAGKPSDEKPRDEHGKFVKTDEKGAAPENAEDDEDAQLTEKVRRIIGKKHRAQKEAEEFARERDRAAEAAERRAEAAEALLRKGGTKSEGPKPGEEGGSDPDEPKPGDFKTVGEYTRALVKYEAKKAGETGKAQAEQTRQQEQANAVVSAFVKRQDEFKAATPDYEEVLESSELIVPNITQQYLVESEFGPQLAYHLAKHPDEVTRLKTLSPSRQIAELGKLETRFEKKADPAANNGAAAASKTEVSKAPAPISPLEGKSTTVNKDPSQMTLQELRAHRQQEARAKAGR